MDQTERKTRNGEPIKLGELNMTPILVAMIVGFIAVGKMAKRKMETFT